MIEVTKEGLLLKEIGPEWSIKDVQDATEAELRVDPSLLARGRETRQAA